MSHKLKNHFKRLFILTGWYSALIMLAGQLFYDLISAGHLQAHTTTPAVPSGSLSDEFNDASTLNNWLEGPSAAYDLLDINTSNTGQLTFVPTSFPHNGWYGDYTGPLRYKLVTGNFVSTMYVNAGNRYAAVPGSTPPTGQYNSAGYLARDPASGGGLENYIMFNIGFQEADLSTEVKTTINSSSILTLTTTAGAQSSQLLLCRVGSTFYMYRFLDNESEWALQGTINRPDLPATLQIGMIVNAWEETNGSDLYAQFDYVRFATQQPTNQNDCLNMIPAPPDQTIYIPYMVRN